MNRPGAEQVAAAHAALTAPGTRFEIETLEIGGVETRVWKHGYKTLGGLLAGTAPFADREFIVFEDERITYRAFAGAVRALAARLAAEGVNRGEVVAIAMPNRPEWLVAFFAVALAGGVCALLNPNAPAAELAKTFADSTARRLIVDLDSLATVSAALAADPPRQTIACRTNGAPALGAETLDDWIGPPSAWGALTVEAPAIAVGPDDEAAIFYTSGTTGQVKGVLTTHRNLTCNIFHAAFRNARRFLLSGEPPPEADLLKAPQSNTLLVVPLFHVSGSANTVLPMMARGGKIVLMRTWLAELGLRAIERERIDIVGGVPTIAAQLLEHPSRGKYDLSSLQQIIYGGAPSSPQMNLAVFAAGFTAGQNWGMTETSGGVIGQIGPEFAARPESCGLPAPVHEVRIGAPDDPPAPPGSPGELWIRGPQVMKGYWNRPDLTAEVLVDGWLKTGDIAVLDEAGYCTIVDRAKDMLICAGENIYSIEIENVLYAHPAVETAAAFGLPHATFGETPAAAVTLRPGHDATELELRAFVQQRLAGFKTPTRLVISIDPLPTNEGGKVLKTELRRRLLEPAA